MKNVLSKGIQLLRDSVYAVDLAGRLVLRMNSSLFLNAKEGHLLI
jgi:hypothetical protein